MKKQKTTKKLTFKKLQITKINNPEKIFGGTGVNTKLGFENDNGGGDGCMFPENASKVKDQSLHI